MASPNLAGAYLSVKQYIKKAFLSLAEIDLSNISYIGEGAFDASTLKDVEPYAFANLTLDKLATIEHDIIFKEINAANNLKRLAFSYDS